MNKISIIIPTWNRRRSIERCLNSLFIQTCTNFEIIVVDDFSSDDSWDFLSKLSYSNLKIIRNSSNCGVTFSRSVGVAHSSAKWLLFLDSDFKLFHNAIETIIDILEGGITNCKVINFMVFYEKLGVVPFEINSVIDKNKVPYKYLSSISPDVKKILEPFYFKDYLEWINFSKCSAQVSLLERSVFSKCKWPLDRSFETEFYFCLYKENSALFLPKIIGIIFEDNVNAISSSRGFEMNKYIEKTYLDRINSYKRITLHYEKELLLDARSYFLNIKWNIAYLQVLSKDIKSAFKSTLHLIRLSPLSIKSYSLLGLIIFSKPLKIAKKNKNIRLLLSKILNHTINYK